LPARIVQREMDRTITRKHPPETVVEHETETTTEPVQPEERKRK
jgi:hypothetical protein